MNNTEDHLVQTPKSIETKPQEMTMADARGMCPGIDTHVANDPEDWETFDFT